MVSSLVIFPGLLLVCGLGARAAETNLLVWHRAADRVDADVRGEALLPLLRQIAVQTGWRVYVEPGTSRTVSAKFQDLPASEALRLLLGELNFTIAPQTNAGSRLYVFSTRLQNATQLVPGTMAVAKPKHVPNELLLKLKPGVDADALAKALGAKIIARDDKLGIYRFQFADAAATDAALAQLQNNSDVAAVDYNYYLDPPPPIQPLASASVPPVSLQLKPPGDSGRVIVGLVDTSVQPLDGSLNDFLLKQISVAGDANASPDLTHGTAMAETILRSLGIVEQGNSSVQIMPVDVYGPNADTTSWNVALGIAAAVNGGANVINLSLGGTGDSSFLANLIQAAQNGGVLIFAAAGNEPVSAATYPAAYPGVIAVTAEEQGKLAPYANFGSFVDLAAPDSSIVYLGNQPWFVQGTSVSTAYMTGLAAGTADFTHQTWAQIQAALTHSYPVPGK
jgi:Subtilase family/Fervidolysin N-terminal prodomain